jgi:hypothetical protein
MVAVFANALLCGEQVACGLALVDRNTNSQRLSSVCYIGMLAPQKKLHLDSAVGIGGNGIRHRQAHGLRQGKPLLVFAS